MKKLREGYDGTAGMALKIHLLEIEIRSDEAPILSMIAGTIDDLRAELRTNRQEKTELVRQRFEQAQNSQTLIDTLGVQLLAGKDEKGRALTQEQLDTLRAVLHQRILQRNELQADAQHFGEDLTACDKELQDIGKLEQRLDGMAEVERVYLERLLAAVENSREGLVKETVVEGRKQLQEVVAVLEARVQADQAPIPAVRDNKAVRQGVPVPDWSKIIGPKLTPEESKLVDEELQKLQKRVDKRN